MSEDNVERARRGYELVDVAYRTGTGAPVERHLAETFDDDVVMEGGEAEIVFTEGEWHGRADDRCVRLTLFADLDRALAAAGRQRSDGRS